MDLEDSKPKQKERKQREYWNSRIGVVFAVMGGAIGLGNYLRFPGLAARYGGGSFFISYIVALLLLGLPIMWVEWSLGRRGGRHGFHSSPGIFHALSKNRFSTYLGVLGLVIPVGIFIYYVFIEAWCLYYAFQYLTNSLALGQNPEHYKSFFYSFLGFHENGALLQNGLSAAVYAVLLCYALNFIVIYRGINQGLELVARWAIPVLFLCSVIILIRVLTLGTPNPAIPEQNISNGLGYMWNPGGSEEFWSSLWNAEMWLAAAGQIFFSLSVGFGVIISYGSYLRKNDDVFLSGLTAASGNIFAEIALGGLITIPAAFVFLGASGITDSSFSLGFISLPNVFAAMPGGQFIGFLWFFLLFIAAFTSSLSMLQPAVAFFQEGLHINRKTAIILLSFVCLIGTGFITYFSKESRALDILDFWIGTAFIYIMATILIIFFGWGIGAKEGLREAQQGSLIRLPQRFFVFIIKYISPLYLMVIFAFWLYDKMPFYWEQIQEEWIARYTVFFYPFTSCLFYTFGYTGSKTLEKTQLMNSKVYSRAFTTMLCLLRQDRGNKL